MKEKILILSLPGIGDTLMATPMIKILRQNRPDAEIWALTMQKGSYETLETNPNLDKVLFFDFQKQGNIKSLIYCINLKKEKFDVSITIYPSVRMQYQQIAFLIGAKKRIAHSFCKGYWSEFHFLNTNLIPADETKHNVINNLNLLQALGIIYNNDFLKKTKLEVYPTKKDEKNAGKFLNDNNLVNKKLLVFHNGTSTIKKGSEKRRLSMKNYVSAIKKEIERDYTVLIPIDSCEKAYESVIKTKLKKNICFVKGLNIRELAVILKKSKKLKVIDSGIMHLGAAVGCDIDVFLGNTDKRKIYPWNTSYKIISKNLPCSPCYLSYTQKEFKCNHPEYKKTDEVFPCMKDIFIKKLS